MGSNKFFFPQWVNWATCTLLPPPSLIPKTQNRDLTVKNPVQGLLHNLSPVAPILGLHAAPTHIHHDRRVPELRNQTPFAKQIHQQTRKPTFDLSIERVADTDVNPIRVLFFYSGEAMYTLATEITAGEYFRVCFEKHKIPLFFMLA